MNWFRKVPKWILALMLGGVSVSFIFWGIGNVFNFTSTSPLVRVGDAKIDVPAFQHEYNHYLKERSDQERHQISSEEGRARGLDLLARDRLITRLLLTQKAHDVGLSVSREQVIDTLKTIPGLSDGRGNINPQALAQILQNNDTNEAGLINQIQGDMVQHQLIGTVLASVRLPPGLIAALQHFRLERRVAEYVLIEPARAGEIKDPDDAALKKYYEANIVRFSAPEYRSVTVATASAKEIAASLEVKDDEIKAAYEAKKSQYQTPDKRTIEQIRFPSEEKARAARAQLDAGKSFDDVAKAAGYKLEDIKLGEVAAGDRTVPAEAFSLELMKPSGPVKGQFGWVIVRATASTPGTVKTLEDARQEIRDAIAADKAKDQAFELSKKYDDARGAGASIEDAGKRLNFKVTKLAAVDRNGKNDAGQTIDNIPVAGDFLSRVFNTESGIDSELQENEDGVYYEFRVDSVKPAAKKPFENVRAEVLAMWRAEQQQKRLQTIAADLTKRGNGGETMAKIAASLGVAALKSDPLPRFPATGVFSQDALKALFDTKVGGFFAGPVADGKSMVVARVDASVQKAEGAADAEAGMYSELLNQAFVGDIAEQFTDGVRREYPPQVDENQFKRIHAGE